MVGMVLLSGGASSAWPDCEESGGRPTTRRSAQHRLVLVVVASRRLRACDSVEAEDRIGFRENRKSGSEFLLGSAT